MSSFRVRLLIAFVVVAASGCGARYIRLQEKGLTCVEAHRFAIDAVRRMGYTITETTKAMPGAPGLIMASRQEGTSKRGVMVSIFCTAQGAEVEAKTEQGGLAELSFPEEFRRSFATAAAKAPPRPAAQSGLDVLLDPDPGGGYASVGVDLSTISVLPISVRITNRTERIYRFRATGVVLQTDTNERVRPLPVEAVAAKLSTEAGTKVRDRALADRDIMPNETATGFLFFPFKSYERARVELTDRFSGEAEGFSIEF